MTTAPSEQPHPSNLWDLPALTFAMTFPTFMAWLYFMVLPSTDAQGNPLLKLAFFVGKAVNFAFPLAFVFLTDRQQLRLAPFTWRGMGLAVGFALATAGAIFLLYFQVLRPTSLFEATAAKAHNWLQQMHLGSMSGFLGLAGFVAVFHSLLEEYYWRWFVFGWLRRQLPWIWAAVISALAFMSHHVILLAFYFPGNFWPVAVPFSLGVAVGGFVWAWIYQRTGSIYAVWASHCLIDLALMVVAYDLLLPHL